MKKKNKFLLVSCSIIIAVFVLVYLGISLTENIGKSDIEITAEEAGDRLTKLYSKVKVRTAEPMKGQIDLDPVDISEELPDISKFEISVDHTTDSYVEIFSSIEKAGKDTEGWLNEVAEEFNKAKITVDGKTASVQIRNIASGTATDFIKSGKYIPEAFTPSNEFWGEMVRDSGVDVELITERLVGNVPGIVLTRAKHNELVEQYGSVNAKTVIEAMTNNELAMGYTDPFASSTGLNFLITSLYTFDSSDLLSEQAIKGFESFQSNVPFLASTTIQMREAAKSGRLDGFVLEYQTYVNSPDLKDSYVFTPFGFRHDSPLYALGDLPAEKVNILKRFAEFVSEEKYQTLGKKYGFNNLENYTSEIEMINGSTLSAAQKLWKEKKSGGKPIAAVFVADVSGSMDGEPISRLKESLIKGQKYLGTENSIGLVTYSDDVTINLPIDKYDTNQQSLFVGAVESLQANGGTATYDGITVAMKMLMDELEENPDIRPLIFVLSDGETNKGHSLKDIRGLIETYKIPIYTIGYNANIEALESISSINEAANINADTDDVIYKIKSLFNVQM
ncbi:VWA domain-containing protein [Bacillus sp. AGMB 02131]|uniref:VWA domain-containing protein n=1 Tax=Peribacillus faecalis TaxID=2772559 RepID=A0A927CVD1_9BACI|nr:VWA domain-containing protein [Peribacillus faecalis]MBD3108298.1 VWA domain-containing protein [Peribacillus faecalis]